MLCMYTGAYVMATISNVASGNMIWTHNTPYYIIRGTIPAGAFCVTLFIGIFYGLSAVMDVRYFVCVPVLVMLFNAVFAMCDLTLRRNNAKTLEGGGEKRSRKGSISIDFDTLPGALLSLPSFSEPLLFWIDCGAFGSSPLDGVDRAPPVAVELKSGN